MPTYTNEKTIPRLPVPSLSATASQLLAALKPLVSPEEYLELLSDASTFVENPYITLIQKHLEEIGKNPDIPCYLSSINDETNPGIYGELRGDILPRNPYLILEEDPYSQTLTPPNQCQRAANLINSSLKFIVSLRNETLNPDVTPTNGNPLTMNCYKNLFGTTRIPSVGADNVPHISIKRCPGFAESRHIVVICNNQYYKLEVLTDEQGEESENLTNHHIWFSDVELSAILTEIVTEAERVDSIDAINNSIGSITTQSFSLWRQGRVELTKTSEKSVADIDTSLFVVVLDHTNRPVTDQEKTEVISHGTSKLLEGSTVQTGSCTSRWYDKLQLIVCANSVAGVVWELTSMDSTAILRFISDIYTDLILKLAKNINGSEYTLFDDNVKFVSGSKQALKPKQIKLVFDKTPELQNLIHLSETRLADIINQHEYKTLDLKIDNHLITKFGISVDSFLQVCFQITNYTLYGRMVNTLEPITTRKFRDARTELIPVQNELIAKLSKWFITDSNLNNLWDLFISCCLNHTKQYREAMSGLGFERHFTSLLHVLNRPLVVDYLNELNPDLPAIPDLASIDVSSLPLLSNPVVEKITKPELLISNCGNPALHLFGIPPAIDQGFGIGYIIHKDKVQITVSSKHRQTKRFLDTFNKIINDIRSIVKNKSNFLVNIADSEVRKMELQQLRIQKELKNVDLSSPLTRHPIEITIDKTTIPLKVEESRKNQTKSNQTKPRSNSLVNDYDLFGGYGYFDFGQLDIRTDEISRNESFMSSHSSVTSRQQSSTNLLNLSQHQSQQDVKHKYSLSDRIRDRLSEELLEKVSESQPKEEKQPRNRIGRPLDVKRSG